MLVTTLAGTAAAQEPGPGAASPGAPVPVPALPPTGPATGTAAYAPPAPPDAPSTRPAPAPPRVWRLVDPTEADWHSPDPDRPRGWVRMDTDVQSTHFYVGGSFRIADGLAFAPFAHLTGSVAEPNLALTWTFGSFWLMPALGTSLDFGSTEARSIDPQLFAAVDIKPAYVELWAQYFLASAYHANATDEFNGRFMLLATPWSVVGFGGEVDWSVATKNWPGPNVLSLPVGGRVNLRIGDRNTVGLFVGYQCASQARGALDGVAGRFEYVHQW
jgi:hypothetical protein